MPHPVRTVGWGVLYLVLAIGPLPLSLINLDPGRGFWVNFSVALGFVGLALMGMQFVLAARFTRTTGVVGFDILLQVHRQMTAVITVCVLAHPFVLMVWDTRFAALLDVVHAPVRAKLAVLSVLLLLVLVLTSMGRRRLRLSYQAWQLLHATLATLIVITALVHVLLIGYYVDQPWERALWIVYSAAFVWIGFWVRVIRPLARWRRRFAVVGVREEPGGHTVTLRPVRAEAFGPSGFRFRAGQFAWIRVGRSPFAIDYHPFSISSSAEQSDTVEFTIKTEKGFTATVHDLRAGQTVYLDGPWGNFSMDDHEGPGFVFLGGGVGITPLLSMLATLADRADRRPCWVFLGNRSADAQIGLREMTELTPRLDLTLIPVVSTPDARWSGRRGRIDAALLDEYLPPSRDRLQYFICGSPALMDGIEAALRELRIPPERVHAERFAMA